MQSDRTLRATNDARLNGVHEMSCSRTKIANSNFFRAGGKGERAKNEEEFGVELARRGENMRGKLVDKWAGFD